MRGSLRAVAIAIVMVVAPAARAEPVKVEVAADGVPAWQAAALQTAIARTIDLDKYRGVVVQAALAHDALRWTVVVKGAPMKRGEIALHGTDVKTVAGTLKSAIGRVMQPGAHSLVEAPAAVGAAPSGAVFSLISVALFLILPFLVGRPRAMWKLRSSRRTAATVVAIGGVAAALVTFGDRVGEASWAVMIAGGLAWGTFGAVTLPVIFPALPGLDRVEHSELVGVLARWALLALQRIAEVAVFYAPFIAALIGATVVLDLPTGTIVILVAPAWALCVRLWIQSWVEIAADRLDRDLVLGDTTLDNAWHVSVMGYLLGYCRRAGWTADERLVEGIRFLPGKSDAVITYGGGMTHARIVIPRTLLELALAPYGRPHDYAAPRVSTLHWTLWNAGLVVPTEVGAQVATREQRQPRSIAVEGDIEAVVLGELPTLAGIVEPQKLDPRPAFRPEEDPLWLDFDVGEEFDGTDAGDKDFLFGLLVHELGRIRRHEDRRATLSLVLHRRLATRPKLSRVVDAIERAVARPVTAIGNVHVTLNFARDHFVQYLAWQLWRRDDELTARAHMPELERQTDVIARTVETEAAGDPRLRARLARLTRATIPSGRARLIGRLAFAAIALAVVGGIALAVRRAVGYHDTYEARIKPQPPTEDTDGQGN